MPVILAIDDKPDNLLSISALLKVFIPECKVITATSGVEGISKAIEHHPDTILLDVKMPGMDGYEVCKKLKTEPRTGSIPIIMITAIKTDSQSRVKGLEMGADAFLSKPIDSVELSAQVNVMLKIKKIEDLLRNDKAELEERVRKRTIELIRKNEQLENENKERLKAEAKLKESLEEKKVLLKEVHHRVKNNMAIISSFLFLQAINTKNDHLKDLLRSSQNRVLSMALVHEQLYQDENLKNVNILKYITRLIDRLLESYGFSKENLILELDIIPLTAALDVLVPMGMLINEIISNSLKHAFKDCDNPKIVIRLKKKELGSFVLTIKDNGPGIPDDAVLQQKNSLGYLLITDLVQQLSGTVNISRENGTSYDISFCLQEDLYKEKVTNQAP